MISETSSPTIDILSDKSPWPHFTAEEFHRAVPSCSPLQMGDQFMKHIEEIRVRSGVPMKINSAFRSYDYERSMGRSGNSFHCLGQAIDISCTDSVSRYKLVEACMFFGILSMKIYPTFIHFDNRRTNKLMI